MISPSGEDPDIKYMVGWIGITGLAPAAAGEKFVLLSISMPRGSFISYYKLQITRTSTLLTLYSQDDNTTSDALTRDMHLQLTRYQMADPR